MPVANIMLTAEISSEGVLHLYAVSKASTEALHNFWKRAADEGLSPTKFVNPANGPTVATFKTDN